MSTRSAAIALGIFAVLVLAYAGAERGLSRLDAAEREALRRRGEAEHFTALGDGVVHYRIAGPESGELVMLVHGFSSPGFVWRPYLETLSSAGYRVIAPDLYGRGFSDRPDVDYDAGLFDRELVGVLQTIGVAEPIHLVGKSMGGAVATVFAARHPDRVQSLTLIAPAVVGENGPSRAITLPLLGDWFFAVAGSRIFSQRAEGLAHQHEDPGAYLEGFKRQLAYPGYPRAMLSSSRHFLRTDFRPFRKDVGAAGYPVLVVWGSADLVVPAVRSKTLVEDMPRARLELIDAATHAVERERFERVSDLLRDHLGAAAGG